MTDCRPWTEDAATGELRCADACPHWWYSESDGLCKEEIWRKDVAIIVPTVLGVCVIVAVVLGVLIAKKKRTQK